MSEYTCTEARFLSDVAKHSMTVLRDEGVDRHLRFRFAGGGFCWFDIVTWQGRLVITGDCETFVFSRLDDMFEFFRSSGGRINPQYWQEKILDGRDRARGFDWDHFRSKALEAFDRATARHEDFERRAEARKDLEDELDEADSDEFGAVQLLRGYQYRPDGFDKPAYFYFDLSDGGPDGKTWDFHYIWCCRAIVWAIQQYDQHHAAQAATIPTEAS